MDNKLDILIDPRIEISLYFFFSIKIQDSCRSRNGKLYILSELKKTRSKTIFFKTDVFMGKECNKATICIVRLQRLPENTKKMPFCIGQNRHIDT